MRRYKKLNLKGTQNDIMLSDYSGRLIQVQTFNRFKEVFFMNINMLRHFVVAIAITVVGITSATAQETSSSAKTTKAPAAAAPKVVDPSKISDDVFFLTDANWEKGVALNWAGFFVKNTPENLAQYIKGNTVVLGNGEKRTITSTAPNPPYLEVRVSGEKFKSEAVGLPSKFKVIVNADAKSAATSETKKPTTEPKTKTTK
jgi:hypothetical protein